MKKARNIARELGSFGAPAVGKPAVGKPAVSNCATGYCTGTPAVAGVSAGSTPATDDLGSFGA